MTESIVANSDSGVASFLETIYPTACPTDGYFSLWELPGKVSRHFDTRTDGWRDRVVAQIEQWMAERRNVFYGVGLRAADYGEKRRGGKASVVALPGLWLDIDLQAPGHAAANLPEDPADASRRILLPFANAGGLDPTLVVHSGGGLHLYWCFDKPLVVTDANRAEVAALSVGIQQPVITLGEKAGLHVDDTADLARVLRPVGSTNFKTGQPRPVQVLLGPGRRYSLDEIRASVARLARALPAAPTAAPAPAPIAVGVATGVTVTGAQAPAGQDTRTSNEILDQARARLKKMIKWRPERKTIIEAVLAGKPFARPGERDRTLQKVASWLGFGDPDADPELLAEILQPSLDTMAEECPDDYLTLDDAVEKLTRARDDARRDRAERAECERRIADGIAAKRAGMSQSEGAATGSPALDSVSGPGRSEESPPTADPGVALGPLPHGAAPPSEWPTVDRASGLPIVYITADLEPAAKQVTYHLRKHLYEHVSTGRLGTVVRGRKNRRFVFEPMARSRLVTAIAEHVFLSYGCKETDSGEYKPARLRHTPDWLVQRIYDDRNRPGYRPIVGVVESQILDENGEVVSAEGYHPGTGLVVNIEYVVHGPMSIAEGKAVLDELVCDWDFTTPSHKAAFMAALITGFCRRAYRGPTPLTTIEAAIQGLGKSLLADLVHLVVFGRPFAPLGWPDSEKEMRDLLVGCVLDMTPMVLLDNIKTAMDSAELELCLTSPNYSGRILGGNSKVDGPMPTQFFATVNRGRPSMDMVRRTNYVKLTTTCPRPSERDPGEFKHNPLDQWALANRGRIIAAILSILHAFVAGGRKLPEGKTLCPFGRYEGWNELVCGAVVAAGWADPGLARAEYRKSGSPEMGFPARWVAALEAIGATSRASRKRPQDLLDASDEPLWRVKDPKNVEGRQVARQLTELFQEDPKVRAASGKSPTARVVSDRLWSLQEHPVDDEQSGGSKLIMACLDHNQRSFWVEYAAAKAKAA